MKTHHCGNKFKAFFEFLSLDSKALEVFLHVLNNLKFVLNLLPLKTRPMSSTFLFILQVHRQSCMKIYVCDSSQGFALEATILLSIMKSITFYVHSFSAYAQKLDRSQFPQTGMYQVHTKPEGWGKVSCFDCLVGKSGKLFRYVERTKNEQCKEAQESWHILLFIQPLGFLM